MVQYFSTRASSGIVFVVLLVGCQGSISTLSSTPSGTKGNRSSTATGSTNSSRSLNDSVLRINGESLDPADAARDLYEDLLPRRGELSSDQFRLFVEKRTAQWLTDRITESLLYQKASLRLGAGKEQHVDRYVDAEIRRVVTREYGGVQLRFERALEARGQTLEYYRERLRREAVITAYLDGEIKSSIAEPSRRELQEVFDAEVSGMNRDARRSMSLIEVRPSQCLAVSSTEPTAEQITTAREEARRRILAAQAALASGRPFAEVARQYSQDYRAHDGGVWGQVSRGSVRERYEPAVEELYRLGAGQVSGIIEGPDSFFLVRCDHAESTAPPRFSEVQTELRERYFRGQYNAAVRRMIEALHRTARLEPQDLNGIHRAAVEKVLAAL